MSIDMKSYGSDYQEVQQPAAVTNSYADETQHEEYPVHHELIDKPAEKSSIEEPSPAHSDEATKQELNFKALRDEVERLKAERESERNEFRANLDLLRANAVQSKQPEASKPQRMFELEKSEIPNVGEIESALERQIAQREAGLRAQIEELSVAQQHPDYAEVLEKYTAPLLKQKPHLAEGIHGASNKALYAYELGKLWQQQQQVNQAPPTQPSVTAQRIVDNAKKPGSLAQAGGQGILSKADFYATMSDQEFMKMAAKNLGEI